MYTMGSGYAQERWALDHPQEKGHFGVPPAVSLSVRVK